MMTDDELLDDFCIYWSIRLRNDRELPKELVDWMRKNPEKVHKLSLRLFSTPLHEQSWHKRADAVIKFINEYDPLHTGDIDILRMNDDEKELMFNRYVAYTLKVL